MIILEHHKQAKREIVTRFQQLAEVAEAVGMITLAREHLALDARIPKLQKQSGFHASSCSASSMHGKSTFVNSLLGADILPTGITPTTASINHVVHAPHPTARVVLGDGESRHLDPGQLKEWVTVAGGHASEVAFVVSFGYQRRLARQQRRVLVGTPGSAIQTSSAPRSRTATCRAPTRSCSCSTPARRSRTANASSCAVACSRVRAIG